MRISDWSSDVCSSDLKLLPLFFRLGGRHCGGRSNRCDSGLNGHLSRSCGLGINAKMEALEGVEDERLDVTPVEAAIAASRRRQSDRTDAGGPSLLGKVKEARLNPAKLRSIAPVVFGSERCPLTAVEQGKQNAAKRQQDFGPTRYAQGGTNLGKTTL